MTSGTEGVLARVGAIIDTLPESEREVARFIAAHPAEVVRLPISKLTERTGVSTASIIRCARSLGFQGLRELKFALAAESALPVEALGGDISPDDSAAEIARKVLLSNVQAITDTLSVLEDESLESALTALLNAKRIECYGVGSSTPIATDAYYRFLRIGLPVAVVTDAYMQAVSASKLDPESVVLAVSHKGRTPEILNALEIAKSCGATTILLTSFSRSPSTQFADITLVSAARENAFKVEAMGSRIAHLSIIDALFVGCALRRFDDAVEALAESDRVVEALRVQRPSR